ncbi:MAG: alkaline phosphatase [Phycisphaera sp.]|nr:MAG: alkaline phosphatase [Phycisphaera sp.]
MNEYPEHQVHSNLSRRRLLGLGATGAVAATLPAGAIAQRPPEPSWPKSSKPVRNIIFMVSDGMSAGTFTLADMMRKHKGMGSSHWRMLWDKPGVRRATCMTHSANGWVTDSAAAGSAWGCGEHINNGAINFTPDERTPEPIHITAQKLGKATGLVSTSRITHATPASFIANVPKRSLEDAIAEQILERNVDVALGGGAKHFPAELLAKHPDMTVARSLTDLNAAATKSGRLLGLFHDDHCHFELDRPAELPSLRQMAEAALTKLENRDGGFILQIEGARIDHAAHDNDAAGMIFDQIEFDEAIGAVAKWATDRDDTLIIVTTDHACANPGLTYYAESGNKSFDKLSKATRSFEWISREFRKTDKSIDAIAALVETATGISLNESELATLGRAAFERQPIDAFDIANGTLMTLGALLANHTGVGFVSPNHTADYVEVTALGPGSEEMPSFIDNIHLHSMMLAAMDTRVPG